MILAIGVAFAVSIFGWIIYQVFIRSPLPKICGSSNAPLITSSPRVKLHDGRHLAYRELGVSKEKAKHKIIICHGVNSCKDMNLAISQEVLEELKVYLLIYDRAGHCESDPYPSRSAKTEAFDIQELVDKLELGTKFYIIGCSLGTYPVLSCLNYIPHRLVGAALVVPIVNFWWPSIPSALSQHSLKKFSKSYIRTFWIAHYMPWMFHWWMTQKWFPKFETLNMLSDADLRIKDRIKPCLKQKCILQEGGRECNLRDLLCCFGKWEFDPTDLTNPFPDNKGSVHMWQGSEDCMIPIELNRFIAQKHPWIKYHELPNFGHLLIHEPENLEAIIRTLLVQ